MPRQVRVATPEGLRQDLARFEHAYGMASDEFLRRWHGGDLDDRLEYFEWFGVCHLAIKMGVLAQPKGQGYAIH